MILPLNYRVIVKPKEVEEIDEKYEIAKRINFQLIESERERLTGAVDQGIILHIGAKAELAEELKVGDEVFFARYAGKKLIDPITKEEVLALNDEDLIAVVRKD